jgi:hypothetical protein
LRETTTVAKARRAGIDNRTLRQHSHRYDEKITLYIFGEGDSVTRGEGNESINAVYRAVLLARTNAKAFAISARTLRASENYFY